MDKTSIPIFLAGLFFGGAIDHAILGAMGRTSTPYGLSVGVAGNWGMAALDLFVTVALVGIARRMRPKR